MVVEVVVAVQILQQSFLRPVLPLGITPSLEDLERQCQSGVLRPDGTRVLLPVIPHVYDQLVQESTEWEAWVKPLEPGRGPWRLALHVSNILMERVSQPGAELVMPALLDGMIYGTMQLLSEMLGGVSMKRHRNQSEPSLTQSSLRPDMWLLAAGAMLFKAEEKTHNRDMPAARDDLLSKMTDWNYAYHGKVPYLLCYAAAGLTLQFLAITREKPSVLSELTPVVMVNRRFTRAHIIHIAMLLYCVIDSLVRYLPEDHKEYGNKLVRLYGTTVTLLGSAVLKHVKLHENPFLAQISGRMDRVYKAQSPYLIAAETGYPRSTRHMYTVHLKPMGQVLTLATVPLHLLRVIVRCILQGLLALHKAGFAHGDLRWDNIIWVTDTLFVVIDLECTVALHDLDEQKALLGCNVRPRAWGPNLDVLVNGAFTAASDLCMLGSMLEEIRARDPTKVDEQLVKGLLQKQWASVEEVERVGWLQG